MAPRILRARAAGAAPSDLVRVGVIGVNGMGAEDLRAILRIPTVECGALCDVDASVLHRQASRL